MTKPKKPQNENQAGGFSAPHSTYDKVVDTLIEVLHRQRDVHDPCDTPIEAKNATKNLPDNSPNDALEDNKQHKPG